MHAMSSPHYFTHGSTCYTARNAAWNFTVGKLPSNDLANSRFIMIIGRNPAGGIDLGEVKGIVKAKEKGAKVVVVDPRHSETAILADEWLPIKPGTDLAFLLAMINVMVEEKLYDQAFVKNSTVGFQQLEDEIINYPPEWAEKICEIPAQTIIRITREMAREKPQALIHRGYHGAFGVSVPEQLSDRAGPLAIVNSLLGNINRKGGIYFPESANLGELQPTHPVLPDPQVQKPMGRGFPGRYPLGAYGDGISHAIPELALRGELKCGFVYHNNPLGRTPIRRRVIAGYKKLELLVVIDTVLSETASIAHYVLPDSFYLEADEAVDTKHYGKRAQVSIQQQVIEPLFDSRSGFQIIIDLAKHLGVGKYFDFTLDEANALRLKPLGANLEEFEGRRAFCRLAQHWKEGFRETGNPLREKWRSPRKPSKSWDIRRSRDGRRLWFRPIEKDPHSFRLHPRETGHSYPCHDGQPAVPDADQQAVRPDPALDQPGKGGEDRREGRRCG